MSFAEKARLINSDPVTCSRYFDFRIREFLELLKSKNGISKDNYVTHWTWRIEFQQRGSPHFHGFFWLK